MGNIWRFDIGQFFDKDPNLRNFVETGTCEGEGVNHAQQFPFKHIHTIEIMEELYDQCRAEERFWKDTRVKFWWGHSPEVLPQICTGLKGRTLFWLDAHFPGVDTARLNLGIHDEKDPEKRCPLQKEIEAICGANGQIANYFIIDDLRVYEDGPFESGNWPDRHVFGGDGIDFAYQSLGKTHKIIRQYEDNGYIVAMPK